MSGFGPFYPRSLQDAVNHADRLANVLRRLAAPGAVDEASLWITGRADEIACLVEAVTRDWRAERLCGAHAARDIGRYVDGLHHELRARLGVEGLPCCSVVLDDTAEPYASFAVTIEPGESVTPGTTTLLRGLDYPVAESRR